MCCTKFTDCPANQDLDRGPTWLRKSNRGPMPQKMGLGLSRFLQLTNGNQCTMCNLFSIFFRATEQAQTYLKIWVWHPIKHVFVPACSSVRKVHLFTFLWFWNSRYVISPKICPCILPFFPKYAPSSSSSSLGHSRPSASLSTTNIVDLLSTIIVLF